MSECDQACQRLINLLPDDIVSENYEDCINAFEADEKLKGQLTPKHCRAIYRAIRDYIDQSPDMDRLEKRLAQMVAGSFMDRSELRIPASYMISKRIYKTIHKTGRAGQSSTIMAPGRAVPVQVLHWMHFKNDIRHDITMTMLKLSRITFSKDLSKFSIAEFEVNIDKPATRGFFSCHSDLTPFLTSVLSKNLGNKSFVVKMNEASTLLLKVDFFVEMTGDVLLPIEVKAPNSLQSGYHSRSHNDSSGNLVRDTMQKIMTHLLPRYLTESPPTILLINRIVNQT